MRSVVVAGDTVRVRVDGLVHYEELYADLAIPVGCIRTVRVGPVTPPPGSMRVDGHEVAFADVRAGHFRYQGSWYFAAYDDAQRTVVLDLEDFDVALRPYARVTIEVDDPAATRQAIVAAIGRSQAEDAGPTEVSWMNLAAGDAVVAAGGTRVGTVTHPLGDLGADVFEGVAFRSNVPGIGVCMVGPDDVERVVDGAVLLRLTPDAVRGLPPVALEDMREVVPGRGIFRHARWHREDGWDGDRR